MYKTAVRRLTGTALPCVLAATALPSGAQESQLTIYYYTSTTWVALPTAVDEYFNLATTPSQGEGVYALMASIQLPLTRAGWNLMDRLPGRDRAGDAGAGLDQEKYYKVAVGLFVSPNP